MDRILEISLLYDFYGELLTEKQRLIFSAVRFEDLSLAEAAEEYGISRQGIYDTLQRTESSLRRYEEKLGLVRKFLETKQKASAIRLLCEKAGESEDRELMRRIEELTKQIEEL